MVRETVSVSLCAPGVKQCSEKRSSRPDTSRTTAVLLFSGADAPETVTASPTAKCCAQSKAASSARRVLPSAGAPA